MMPPFAFDPYRGMNTQAFQGFQFPTQPFNRRFAPFPNHQYGPKPMGPRPGGNQGRMQGNPRGPMQNNQNRGGMQNRGGPRGGQNQPGRPQQKQQPQLPPKPAAELITVQNLRKKLNEFLSWEPDKQRQILGELLYPKVSKHTTADLAPKITGMLIDLSVLEVQEILEFLEDDTILQERVLEAVELIKGGEA